MKKILLSKKVLFAFLLVVLYATTVVSLSFWQSGINGNTDSDDYGGMIGEGVAVTTGLTIITQLDLSQNTIDDVLIPHNRTELNDTELSDGKIAKTQLHFTSSVKWVGIYDIEDAILNLTPEDDFTFSIAFDKTEFTGFTSEAITARTVVSQNPVDSLWYQTYSIEESLFFIEINFDYDSFEIVEEDGDTFWAAQINWIIRMNEPIDQEDYDLVVNGIPTFFFNFDLTVIQ